MTLTNDILHAVLDAAADDNDGDLAMAAGTLICRPDPDAEETVRRYLDSECPICDEPGEMTRPPSQGVAGLLNVTCTACGWHYTWPPRRPTGETPR